jgi:transcriptional regulator with XRE-family HTH domain
MSRPDPIEVVARVIDQASDKRGWSLAQLTRRLGKGDNTLFRWRSGKTHSMDIRSIVQLFELAEMSMDDAFGLQSSEGVDASVSESRYQELRSELGQLQKKLALIEPFAVLLQSLGSSIIAAEVAGREDEGEQTPKAKAGATRKTQRRPRTATAAARKPETRGRKPKSAKRA